MSVLLGNGDGTFQNEQRFGAGDGRAPSRSATWTGTASPTSRWRTRNSDDVSVLLGNGDGTFQAEQRFVRGRTAGAGHLVAIGDLDGDGAADLAVANESSDDVSVLLNQCDADAPCAGDCDGSGDVSFGDLVAMLAEFGTDGTNPGCDADGSGTVSFGDLVATLGLFGPCPE